MPTRWALPDAGRPLCIAVAVNELAKEGSFVRRATFLEHGARKSSLLSWAWSSAAGMLSAAGLIEADDFDEAYWSRVEGDWVLVANVKKATAAYDAYMTSHPPGTLERIQSRSMFAQTLEKLGIGLTADDHEVFMNHLVRQKKIFVEGDLVKLAASGPVSPPTEADRGLLSVRVLYAQLEAQIDALDKRIDAAQERIKAALANKPKSAALSYLRTRKQLEEMRSQRIATLETTSSVLLRIEQAVGDAEIMATYETSVRTLRSLLADPALRPEKVDQTMDALSEAMADQADVHDAINVDAGIDEDEIARELEALALEEKEAQDTKTDVTLPEAPKTQLPAAQEQARPERVAELA
ncbi:hypothetical protein MCUN1_001144 [Malassezia cuniculi]|uniref:Charged multivesicular body protein 7 n=1 Tax=Malassezia cuniculi TaxID=948313 RepID=A0AAF0J5Q5_9BASI|nr:hypothetical protein MCUN1_001144 [Malassezia cuniculi]